MSQALTSGSGQSLRGLRAVVTGAAAGIGAAVARQLIAQGATVVSGIAVVLLGNSRQRRIDDHTLGVKIP